MVDMLHYHRVDWDTAALFVHTALCTKSGLLRVTNVHVGQGGNIQFDVAPLLVLSKSHPLRWASIWCFTCRQDKDFLWTRFGVFSFLCLTHRTAEVNSAYDNSATPN